MEEMKIRFKLILPLLILLCLSSCASTPAGEKGAGTQDVHKEKKQNQKKLLFEDWKYKGFGQELPVWFEAAYKEDVKEIKKIVSELSDCEIKILTAQGINSDQADRSLKKKIQAVSEESSEEYKVYDSSWALLGEKAAADGKYSYPYFAAAVLYIENN